LRSVRTVAGAAAAAPAESSSTAPLASNVFRMVLVIGFFLVVKFFVA
jgi:hypothetical protein